MGAIRRARAMGTVDDRSAPSVGHSGHSWIPSTHQMDLARRLDDDAGVFRSQAERCLLHQDFDVDRVKTPNDDLCRCVSTHSEVEDWAQSYRVSLECQRPPPKLW